MGLVLFVAQVLQGDQQFLVARRTIAGAQVEYGVPGGAVGTDAGIADIAGSELILPARKQCDQFVETAYVLAIA